MKDVRLKKYNDLDEETFIEIIDYLKYAIENRDWHYVELAFDLLLNDDDYSD